MHLGPVFLLTSLSAIIQFRNIDDTASIEINNVAVPDDGLTINGFPITGVELSGDGEVTADVGGEFAIDDPVVVTRQPTWLLTPLRVPDSTTVSGL